jgi:rsbT co-antagonist protein RsbR
MSDAKPPKQSLEQNMSEDIRISPERLTRLSEAISFASVEAFDRADEALLDQHEDSLGEVEGMLRIFFQELKGAQAARAEQAAQQQMIERQRLAIQELSTPIIDIWDDVITLPVVGIVDSQRALDMTERLLGCIAETRARCVIIDITGVNVVDTMTADHFIKMVKAARLLGSYCVVTGISPEIAQTLVQSGVEIGDIKTLRSLKEGLKECFRHLRQVHQRGRFETPK